MKKLVPLFTVLIAACSSVQTIPEPVTPPPVIIDPVPAAGDLVLFGEGASPTLKPGGIDYEWGKKALGAMNEAHKSGCLKAKVLSHTFKSLHSVVEPTLAKTQVEEAYARFVKNAPYALDANWYSTRAGVIGYTYNYRGTESETRIWTNTKMDWTNPLEYSAHLAHELSHQARAGGFVHYTVFAGSFPYDIGDLMWECVNLAAIKTKGLKTLGVPSIPERKNKYPEKM